MKYPTSKDDIKRTFDTHQKISYGNSNFNLTAKTINCIYTNSNMTYLERQYIRELVYACKDSMSIIQGPEDRQELEIEEEIKLSDKLEKLLGKEVYMNIFFNEAEKRRYLSAKQKYQTILDSKNPDVQVLKDELNPEIIFKRSKYKVRKISFDQNGVQKLIDSPDVSKQEKRFLIFNLDKVSDGGTIDLNYKELIYNRFFKKDE